MRRAVAASSGVMGSRIGVGRRGGLDLRLGHRTDRPLLQNLFAPVRMNANKATIILAHSRDNLGHVRVSRPVSQK
jgi:hypothetical protein